MDDTTTVNITTCSYCGYIHDGICPRIEEVEYYPDGAIKRVKFKQDVYTLTISDDEPDQYDVVGHTCGIDCPQIVW